MEKGLQLKFLDEDMNICGIVRPINTQWTRKYYEIGTFSIQIPLSQYIPPAKYLYSPLRKELGVILQENYENKSEGNTIQLSGLFLECELNDKVIYPQYSATKTLEDGITDILNKYKEDIPLLDVSPSQGRGSSTEFLNEGSQLAEFFYEQLKSSEMSFRVNYDYANNKKVFEVYQGVDRTSDRADKDVNPIVFGTSFKNFMDADVLKSIQDFKNYAIVSADIGNDQKITVEVDMSGGEYKKKIFMDAGESYNSEEMTLNEFKKKMYSIGATRLINEYGYVTNVQGTAVSGSYEYLVDYDLGDKVDIVIKECGVSITARIIAVYEVIKDGKHEITLEFGNPIIKNGGKF